MKKDLQKRLSRVENIIGIQSDCLADGTDYTDYMYGLYNGLVLAHSCFADGRPIFKCSPKIRKYKIRHKSKK